MIYFLHSFPFYLSGQIPSTLPPQCFWSISMVIFFFSINWIIPSNYLLQLLWCNCKFSYSHLPTIFFPGLLNFFFFCSVTLVLEQKHHNAEKKHKFKQKKSVYRICLTFLVFFFFKFTNTIKFGHNFFFIFNQQNIQFLYRPKVLLEGKQSQVQYMENCKWNKGGAKWKWLLLWKEKNVFFLPCRFFSFFFLLLYYSEMQMRIELKEKLTRRKKQNIIKLSRRLP